LLLNHAFQPALRELNHGFKPRREGFEKHGDDSLPQLLQRVLARPRCFELRARHGAAHELDTRLAQGVQVVSV